MQISIEQAINSLQQADAPFCTLFKRGSLSIELYKPHLHDFQQPHAQDEVYIIVFGTGDFIAGNQKYSFKANDFFFVPAGQVHRFENFSPDFITWVLFYGPIGGESIALQD
jgi:mannose-6-phosphate isomerase-like protein (cupin superfamily)